LQQAINDQRGVATSLSNLARIARDSGEIEQAIVLNQESMDLYAELKDTESLSNIRLVRAEMELQRGNPDLARVFLDECLAYYQRENVTAYVARCRAVEAGMLMQQGRCAEAGPQLLGAIVDHLERDILDWVIEELEWMSECRFRTGDLRTAALLMTSMDAWRSAHARLRTPAEASIADALRGELAGDLGDEVFRMVRLEGEAMDLAACVAMLQGVLGERAPVVTLP
jgi:hypothetical protein